MFALVLGLVTMPPAEASPPDTRQTIVVSAPRWHTSRAVLRRFEWSQRGWREVGSATPAWLGSGGLAAAANRRQNTGTTPAGVFTLPRAFGRGSGSQVRLPYHRLTSTSYWPYDPRDPRTYNVLQTTRAPHARWRDDGQWSERLLDYGRAYRLAVVVGYNLPGSVYVDPRTGEWRSRRPADVDKGGGIFLHVHRGRPTAGCVAIGLPQMRRVVRWLDPDASPRIVIGTDASTRGWRSRVT
jgi:L,D-peptidoglycan transpeptidase YkuD (ErfK/YbiS/YcfS/YnhG family)